MLKTKTIPKNYTENSGIYQLVLPLNMEVLIPEDDSVRLRKIEEACRSLGKVAPMESILDMVRTYIIQEIGKLNVSQIISEPKITGSREAVKYSEDLIEKTNY